MKIETDLDIGINVYLKPLECFGYLGEIKATKSDIYYGVEYWMEGKQVFSWCRRNELDKKG